MIVIGIDPSINNTGVAVVECEGEKKDIWRLEIIKPEGKHLNDRLYNLYMQVDRLFLGAISVDNMLIVIEQPLMYSRKSYTGKSFNIGSVVKLNMAFASILIASLNYADNGNEIICKPAPSGYGKNKKGLPTKERARYILQAHFKSEQDIKKIKTADLNCIDALMLAVWGCQEGGNNG